MVNSEMVPDANLLESTLFALMSWQRLLMLLTSIIFIMWRSATVFHR